MLTEEQRKRIEEQGRVLVAALNTARRAAEALREVLLGVDIRVGFDVFNLDTQLMTVTDAIGDIDDDRLEKSSGIACDIYEASREGL